MGGVVRGPPGHSWRRTPLRGSPPTGGGNTRPPCHPSKEHPPMNLSLYAPWKEGKERSDCWKETLKKGFLPRVSDRTRRAFISANLGYNKNLKFG
jgi:hypothetical protein